MTLQATNSKMTLRYTTRTIILNSSTGLARGYLAMLLLFVFGASKSTNSMADAFRPLLGQQRKATMFRNHCIDRHHLLSTTDSTTTSLSCGLLDALQNALGGGASSSSFTKATASHILIQEKTPQSKQKLLDLKAEIGDDAFRFGETAANYSDCSSASKGGDLGEFGKGTMAKEFEAVVFDSQTPIGVVQGPIATEFGYHLILVKERS